MKRAVILIAGVLLANLAAAQTPPADPQLEKIRTQMASNLRRLPNYTCLMTVERFARGPSRGTRSNELLHQDTIRLEVAEAGEKELLAWPGAPLTEQRIEDLVPDGVFASGDFGGLANVVFRTNDPKFRPAGKKKIDGREAIGYSYEVVKGISRYRLGRDGSESIVPYHGTFWADPQSGEILRLDLELDGIPDYLAVRSSVTEIDYLKARIGGGDFLLPSRVRRELHYSTGSMTENVSTFTKCREYGTESAVRFDDPVATPDAAAVPLNPTEITLPGGVRLPMKVETVTDAKTAAIGDALVARLTADVQSGSAVFRAGSEVRGRIRLLRYAERGPTRLELEFTEIRTPQAIASFHGFIEAIEKRKGFSLGSLMKPDDLQISSGSMNLSGLALTYRTLAPEK